MKLTIIINTEDKDLITSNFGHSYAKAERDTCIMYLYQSQSDLVADIPDEKERSLISIEKGWLFEPSALDSKVKAELQTDIDNLESVTECIINEWESGGESIGIDELKHLHEDIKALQKKIENI